MKSELARRNQQDCPWSRFMEAGMLFHLGHRAREVPKIKYDGPKLQCQIAKDIFIYICRYILNIPSKNMISFTFKDFKYPLMHQ